MLHYACFISSFVSQERHNAKTVGEIKQFVSQLPHMQAARSSLANHTSIAELIKDITSAYIIPCFPIKSHYVF